MTTLPDSFSIGQYRCCVGVSFGSDETKRGDGETLTCLSRVPLTLSKSHDKTLNLGRSRKRKGTR